MGLARPWVAMTSAGYSHYCRTESELQVESTMPMQRLVTTVREYWPLIEGKQIGQFDHAFATYEGVSPEARLRGNPIELIHSDGVLVETPTPRFWAPRQVVEEFLATKGVSNGWVLSYRDVTNVNNERTTIAAILGANGLLQPLNGVACVDARTAAFVLAAVNSFPCDYVARLRFSGRHLNVTTFSQLPLPPVNWQDMIIPRVLELTYTGWDLVSFARDCGWIGPPFRWDKGRRFLLRCELDAMFFHLYLPADVNGQWQQVDGETPEEIERLAAIAPSPRDAVSYIMDSFSLVKRRDEASFDGVYRTKEAIMERYDALQAAFASGQPYRTILDPPPADRRVSHATTDGCEHHVQ